MWVKRTGNNPGLRVLLLHGGPGRRTSTWRRATATSPGAGIKYYYYDQLGSVSAPAGRAIPWDLDRFVEEVEQVRQALRLDPDNFDLLGHSWGGILAMEYALHQQEHLRGLVISSMMASIPAYNDYANQVLMPAMDQKALAEIKRLDAAGTSRTRATWSC